MKHSSRNLRLSPVQREILRMLEEAGEENLPTVLNTLWAVFPDRSHQALFEDAEAAIQGLRQLGLVAFSRDLGKPNLHSVLLDDKSSGALVLARVVEYDVQRGYWTDYAGEEPAAIGLVLTDAGRTALAN
jgi:hypothetical protein